MVRMIRTRGGISNSKEDDLQLKKQNDNSRRNRKPTPDISMPTRLCECLSVCYTSKQDGREGRARHKRKTRMSTDMRNPPDTRQQRHIQCHFFPKRVHGNQSFHHVSLLYSISRYYLPNSRIQVLRNGCGNSKTAFSPFSSTGLE